MATDDDFETHHTEHLAKQRQKVKESLSEEHAAILLDFVHDRAETGDMADSTARNYLRELRILFEHAEGKDEEPHEWDANDWNRTIRRVARQRGISDGTKRNTCYAARAYCQWETQSVVDDTDDIDAPKVILLAENSLGWSVSCRYGLA